MAKMDIKEIAHYYILAFFLLMAYYLGDYLGITTWAFAQSMPVLLASLTLYYGTVIMIVDKTLHEVLDLK
jgi:hypothetical protein